MPETDLKKLRSNVDLGDLGRRRPRQMFNFRRIWLLSFLLTSGFAVVPLIFFAVIDYNVTKRLTISDMVSRTARLTSNTWRSVSFFLNERQYALRYIVETTGYPDLTNPRRLAVVLEKLRSTYGGFSDLGVIGADGVQQAYAGPYQLMGRNYSGQAWFENVISRGKYISDVFPGFRNIPHLVIAIQHKTPDGRVYVLRATIEHSLDRILAEVDTALHQESEAAAGSEADVFLINHQGVIQTESSHFGKVLEKIPIPIPGVLDKTSVVDDLKYRDLDLVVGYRHIPDTPFILMIAKDKDRLVVPWQKSRVELIQYLSVSITIVILWILGITTYLIKRLKETDRRRVKYLHMAEYSNKLASIGRLAAGVAHEINNPLAIINEKAGLVKDIFSFQKQYQEDPKLLAAMDAILQSVVRCSRITRQLLSFARHMDVSVQQINLKKLLQEVLSFLVKEAEYRSIEVIIDIPNDIPDFESDRGKLQQIFLNLINNAFAAMKTGGIVRVHAGLLETEQLEIEIADTGCGIPKENMDFIFEPFFSTKAAVGGTGLGLSITYSLARELGGRIEVDSTVGEGTTFVITLPLKWDKEDQENESTAG